MKRKKSVPKIGVVFSSGFFGFFAHAGFLSAVRELKIKPSGYSGASSGAIIAAMAASEMSDYDIKNVLFNVKKSDFWDPDPLSAIIKAGLKFFRGYNGYLKGEGFGRLLERIPVKRIEDCPVPLLITATNLTCQGEESFIKGNLKKAIQASGAVPILFKPVMINGNAYVDGGMVNKAPIQTLTDLIKPDKIIVHLIKSANLKNSPNDFMKKNFSPWQIYRLSINISRQKAYQRQCLIAKQQGIDIVTVNTDAPKAGPNSLEYGEIDYHKAREKTLDILSGEFSS
ncbi:MAG: patatin-like phospholipase family protein [Thermodesulfobacteriota bacterium]|nr:patatin-like phospholipase family protein [Thermodesulfobacteriota bacterium]